MLDLLEDTFRSDKVFKVSENDVKNENSFVEVNTEGELGSELQSSQGWWAWNISVKREHMFASKKNKRYDMIWIATRLKLCEILSQN